MRSKNARLDEDSKAESEFASKKASFTPEEVSKEKWATKGKKEVKDGDNDRKHLT